MLNPDDLATGVVDFQKVVGMSYVQNHDLCSQKLHSPVSSGEDSVICKEWDDTCYLS